MPSDDAKRRIIEQNEWAKRIQDAGDQAVKDLDRLIVKARLLIQQPPLHVRLNLK